MNGFRSALAFLTIVGRGDAPTTSSVVWFGPVGLVTGAVVGGAWWAAAQVVPLPVAAGLAVLVDLVLTSMLHVDGLADSADGLIAPMDRERRLAVMAMPDVGAFGVAAVVIVLLLRAASLGTLTPNGRSVALIIALWAAGRTSMAAALGMIPYARSVGLASAFGHRGNALLGLAIGAVASLLTAGLASGVQGLASCAAVAGAATVVLWRARRLVGGYTGDVLGATCLVGETTGLVVATAWIS